MSCSPCKEIGDINHDQSMLKITSIKRLRALGAITMNIAFHTSCLQLLWQRRVNLWSKFIYHITPTIPGDKISKRSWVSNLEDNCKLGLIGNTFLLGGSVEVLSPVAGDCPLSAKVFRVESHLHLHEDQSQQRHNSWPWGQQEQVHNPLAWHE